MPSDTVIVPNSSATPPASRIPWRTSSASARSVMLQGVISFQELAMPICGFAQSSSVRPIARSIARAAAFCLPSVTSRDRGLMSTGCSAVMEPEGRPSRPERPGLIAGTRSAAGCHQYYARGRVARAGFVTGLLSLCRTESWPLLVAGAAEGVADVAGELAEPGLEAQVGRARVRERHVEGRKDPAGARRHDEHTRRQEHGLHDRVGDEQRAEPLALEEPEELVVEVLARDL